jgi:hypothetical protein
MPFSVEAYKQEVFQHIRNTINPTDKILDVGPGAGKYGKSLNDYYIDAVEIYDPYIAAYNLKQIYKNVYCDNILNFDWSFYDYIILGDVLEHINLEEAKKLISDITNNYVKCLVAVPYMFEQGEWYGNIHETHLQPDLTPDNMLLRYPELKLLIGDSGYGYYINY